MSVMDAYRREAAFDLKVRVVREQLARVGLIQVRYRALGKAARARVVLPT